MVVSRPNYSRGLARLAALLLCALLGIVPLAKSAQGFILQLPSRGPDPDKDLTDRDGLYLMVIQSSQTARIRHEQVRLEDLGERLRKIFSYRSERLLLVNVNAPLTFEDFVRFLDAARQVEHLQFALLTPKSFPTKQQPTLFSKGRPIYTQYFGEESFK